MPLSEKEQKDIDILKEQQASMKIQAIEYMLFCKKHGVKNTGYPTIESLVMGTLSSLESRLKRLVDNHIKQYPDDK